VEQTEHSRQLIEAIEALDPAERALLRQITALTPEELEVLNRGLVSLPAPLALLTTSLLSDWDGLQESARVASLIAIGTALCRRLNHP